MVPKMGSKEKIKEIIHGGYRIIYKMNSSQTAHIFTVHHSSKRLRQKSFRGFAKNI